MSASVEPLLRPPGTTRNAQARPSSIAAMLDTMKAIRSQPVVSLPVAIEQLRLLDHDTLARIREEDPDLLRCKSSELVRRMLVTAEDLERALARTCGVVEVDAASFELCGSTFGLLPLRTLRALDCLTLGEDGGLVYVASWCPTNHDMHSRLCTLAGRTVMLVWADRNAIAARLAQTDPMVPVATAERSSGATSVYRRPAPVLAHAPYTERYVLTSDRQSIEHIIGEAVRELASGQEPEESVEAKESSSIVRMVKRMITDAQSMKASDIHIETNPGAQVTRIRLRRDGDMEPYQELPAQLRAPLVSRIKVMAGLDISERRRPQDGKITFGNPGGDHLELRVAILPTHDGLEDAVLRLLASSRPTPLEQLGFQPRDAQTIARVSLRSFGLILAAGPTGSGKTTTLHSMLARVNSDDKKIWTAEDPIEITHPGLRQVQVNPKIGVTFASAMRGFLRADPDIIMIGEIRDDETAQTAIEASLTGHLVLSTLHTNSAAESVVRLLDLGMDAMNFADSLVCIVAQRLVRALCPHCASGNAMPVTLFDDVVREYVQGSPLDEDEGRRRLLAAAGVGSESELRFRSAHGCAQCGGKGHKGRLGIYEILENSTSIRQMIQRGARPSEIDDEAIRAGMHSLRHDALEKWVQGRIDLHQARSAYL